MEMIVYVPHVPHNTWRSHECPCHYHHYDKAEIPLWCFIVGAIILFVVIKIIMYIEDKISKDD
jgi:hypothetical protein